MQQPQLHICLVGGGFGGLYTALRLNQLPWNPQAKPRITLIDKKDHFLFAPLLFEYLNEELQSWEIAPPFAELLTDSNIEFKQAEVIGFELDRQKIYLGNQTQISYDFLVLASGMATPTNTIVGAQEYALPFRTLSDARKVREKLKSLLNLDLDKIRIAIVGGGYSGIELACKIADLLGDRGRIRIIEKGDEILKHSSKFNQESSKRVLEKKHIHIDTNTSVESITSNTISLLHRGQVSILPVELVLWTVGNTVPELITNISLEKNGQGLLDVNQFLQVKGHDFIYALGDIAQINQDIPKTAQAAIQQADFCAWNIWASINNKPLLPFRHSALGEMLSLGIDDASISGLGINLEGILGYLTRRMVYLYRLPTLKHQMNVGLHWLTQPILKNFS